MFFHSTKVKSKSVCFPLQFALAYSLCPHHAPVLFLYCSRRISIAAILYLRSESVEELYLFSTSSIINFFLFSTSPTSSPILRWPLLAPSPPSTSLYNIFSSNPPVLLICIDVHQGILEQRWERKGLELVVISSAPGSRLSLSPI